MNPFDNDVREGQHYTGDVLSNLGWNPESLPGKVGKGVVGFVGDVATDPLSYANPFSAIGKVIKGTGSIISGSKITPLSFEDAKVTIDRFYKSRKNRCKNFRPRPLS